MDNLMIPVLNTCLNQTILRWGHLVQSVVDHLDTYHEHFLSSDFYLGNKNKITGKKGNIASFQFGHTMVLSQTLKNSLYIYINPIYIPQDVWYV